jgi:2-polyprenyl-6-methoxyphenol hydroxylase-like FAD-dependent oxidoreductase
MSDIETDVLIAGAGPVGLLLACELARLGVRVVVAERLASPMTESRASQLSTRTAGLLHERSLGALFDPAARELKAHFAGLPLDLSGLDSDFAGNWKVPQYRTERIFYERARALGATVLREHDITGLADNGEAVRCEARTAAGRRTFQASYLAGCDGVTSTVRELGGFRAWRVPATRELLRADVTGIGIPDRRFQRLPGGFVVAATRDGVTRVMVHAYGQDVATRAGPPGFGEVARLWQQVTGEDIAGGTPVWVDGFDNSKGLVSEYRRGRVLLAGDAAHWHLPIGGQALNTGLGDAVDLGGKLAAVVNGTAPETVLDSYHAERHAAGARVLVYVAAQEFLQLGGPEADPVRAVLAELLTLPPVHDHFARVAAGLDSPPAGSPLAAGLPEVDSLVITAR